MINNSPVFLHLSDIKSENRTINYVQKTIDYVTNELDWKFVGVYGHAVKDIEKENETTETRQIKNTMLLKPTNYVKSFKDGIRVNKYNQALAQSIWYFVT